MTGALLQRDPSRTDPRPVRSVARRSRHRMLVGVSLLAAASVAALALPALGASGYLISLVYYSAFYAAFGQSWNLLSGLTGYLSVAHAAFLGIGAYTTVIAMNADVTIPIALGGAVLVTSVAALLVGLPSLRVSGLAFAFTTLFFLEISRLTVTLASDVTGGGAGVYASTLLSAEHAYYLMVVTALLASVVLLVVKNRQIGRELVAIREDEHAAQTIGIHTTRLKLAAFVVSGAFAGLIGAVHGIYLGYLLPPSIFALELTLIAIALPLIGGMGTVAGPLVAGTAYALLREQLQIQAPSLHLVILGTAVALVVILMPDGIVPKVAQVGRRLSRSRKSS